MLKVLCEMEHNDRLVISDGNFPPGSTSKNAIDEYKKIVLKHNDYRMSRN